MRKPTCSRTDDFVKARVRNTASVIRIGAVAFICAVATEGVWNQRAAIAQIIPASGSTNTQVVDIDSGDIEQLDINGGATSENGKNLFHGFEQFNVDADQLVNFNTTRKIENIFSHITGGFSSTLDGTLQVSGSDANLYLINPSGILFGPNIQLQLPGSLVATTATTIGFGNYQLDLTSRDLHTISYRKLKKSPTFFEFTDTSSDLALDNLSLSEAQTVALMTNDSSDEDLIVTVLEGEEWIQISQRGQILSIELPADENAFETRSISRQLTGSGTADASDLHTDEQGTVRLVDEAVDIVDSEVGAGVGAEVGAEEDAPITESELPPDLKVIAEPEPPSSESFPLEPASFSAGQFDSAAMLSLQASQLTAPSEGGLDSVLEMSDRPALSVVLTETNTSKETATELLRQIETAAGKGFADYLNIADSASAADVATLSEMQETLRLIHQSAPSVRPALVYAYFVPDRTDADSSQSQADPAHGSLPTDNLLRDDDQLEIMAITADGTPMRHRYQEITRADVARVSADFRREATSQFSRPADYLPPAQQLYQWLIQPIENHLSQSDINSLGLVMDDGLRVLPFAALHDGHQFIVEKYSIGLVPTFSLTQFETDASGLTAQVLAMGASEFQNQPPLPAVEAELAFISDRLQLSDTFINESFTLSNLKAKIASQQYGIMHLATHAFFDTDSTDGSYIQLWEERLKLSDLQALDLGASKIAMVILSACSTAVGDRASEYGFAGFALSAGSESAMASLWPVSDEGTLGFMTQFYEQLPSTINQSEALRAAQMSMLSGEIGIDYGQVYGPGGQTLATIPELSSSGTWDFSHPYYWSAFTMIGDPW